MEFLLLRPVHPERPDHMIQDHRQNLAHLAFLVQKNCPEKQVHTSKNLNPIFILVSFSLHFPSSLSS